MVDPEKNKSDHRIVIEPSLKAEWNIQLSGHSASNIFDVINSYSEEDIKEFFTGYFKTKAPKIKVLDYTYDKSQPGIISCVAHFQLPAAAISNDGTRNYLSLKYFPLPTGDIPVKMGCRHILYSTECNNFNIVMKSAGQVKLLKPHAEKSEEKNMLFGMNVSQKTDREISISYNFLSPYLIYDIELYSSYEKISNNVAKSFNNLVAYE